MFLFLVVIILEINFLNGNFGDCRITYIKDDIYNTYTLYMACTYMLSDPN